MQRGLYAQETTVSPEKSRQEIESIINRYGATGFVYGRRGTRHVIQFETAGRVVRFDLVEPDPTLKTFTHSKKTRSGYFIKRTDLQIKNVVDKELRRRWRSLTLRIKAKLEAVASQDVDFDTEFLGYLVLPGGRTVGERIIPELAKAIATGQMPQLALPGATEC